MKRGSLLLLVVLAAGMLHADELELLTGTTFEGTLVEETDQQIRFKVVAGHVSAEMTFRREKVHAITVAGRRRVINERAAAGEKPKPRKPKPAAAAAPAKKKSRTKAEVEKLIRDLRRNVFDHLQVAAVAIPRFSNASALARASMVADNLRLMRMQLEVFKAHHAGVAPGVYTHNPLLSI